MNNWRALDSKTARDGCVPGTLYLQMLVLLLTVLWTAGSFLHIKHWETKDFFPKLEGILISISLPEPVSSSVLLLTKWSGVINPFFILRSAACYKPPAHQVSYWYPQAPRPIHWCSFFVFQIGTEGLPPFTPVEMQHWFFWLRKISLASVCCTGLEIFWLFPILLLSSVWV